MLKVGLVTAVFATGSLASEAKIKFASIFSDDMVMQQNAVVKVHGSAAPGSEVKLSAAWSNQKLKTKADEKGRWVI
ncbi:MAG: glycoside hydrolase family 88 protein, partial [Muribaculaceae bacterium]|nr:glycoside hydrolase family 88 protein [Muribaculaceae bacterium]